MKISICMAVFNRAELLKNAIKSLSIQTRIPDEIVIVDDWSDAKNDLKLVLDKINHEDITIINLFNPIEEIIDSIVSCEKVYSSSLHGIIVSHAYNIPCEWVKFSNNILGDNTKFWDYYMSIGETSYRSPMNLMEDTINPDFLISNNINYPNLKINLDILWESCPFLNL